MARQSAPPEKVADTSRIPLDSAQTRIACIWLIGSGITALIVVIQSLLSHFGDETQQAWEWLLPNIAPTSGMIIAALGYSAFNPLHAKTSVRRTFYYMSIWLSSFYLLLVLLTILIGPFTGIPDVVLMRTSNLWLGPIQALVASALSVLFASKQKNEKSLDRDGA
jgi:hypothetical protein